MIMEISKRILEKCSVFRYMFEDIPPGKKTVILDVSQYPFSEDNLKLFFEFLEKENFYLIFKKSIMIKLMNYFDYDMDKYFLFLENIKDKNYGYLLEIYFYLKQIGSKKNIDHIIEKKKDLFNFIDIKSLTFDEFSEIYQIWTQKRPFTNYLFDIFNFNIKNINNMDKFKENMIEYSNGFFDKEFFNFMYENKIKIYGEWLLNCLIKKTILFKYTYIQFYIFEDSQLRKFIDYLIKKYSKKIYFENNLSEIFFYIKGINLSFKIYLDKKRYLDIKILEEQNQIIFNGKSIYGTFEAIRCLFDMELYKRPLNKNPEYYGFKYDYKNLTISLHSSVFIDEEDDENIIFAKNENVLIDIDRCKFVDDSIKLNLDSINNFQSYNQFTIDGIVYEIADVNKIKLYFNPKYLSYLDKLFLLMRAIYDISNKFYYEDEFGSYMNVKLSNQTKLEDIKFNEIINYLVRFKLFKDPNNPEKYTISKLLEKK